MKSPKQVEIGYLGRWLVDVEHLWRFSHQVFTMYRRTTDVSGYPNLIFKDSFATGNGVHH